MKFWAVVKAFQDPDRSVIAICRTKEEAEKLVEMIDMVKSENYIFGVCEAELYPPGPLLKEA